MFAAMNSHAVYDDAELGYRFPQPLKMTIPTTQPRSRESLLMETLAIDSPVSPIAPDYLNMAITRSFRTDMTTASLPDPLEEIIATSKQLIGEYQLGLRFGVVSATAKEATPPSADTVWDTPTRGTKRTRDVQPQDRDTNTSFYANTPISAKAPGFPSSAGNRKQNVTPALSKKPSLQRLLKTDFASLSEYKDTSATVPLASTPVKGTSTTAASASTEDAVESSYDQLACHADNILRMAVDSTMLGSSYNTSLLSNYSLGPNDSMNGIMARGAHHGDPDRSLLELKRARRSMLSIEKATKFEINADDIKEILGDA
ncbi:hypothetical protein ABC855_g1303 [[Candida] zeylanoides]